MAMSLLLPFYETQCIYFICQIFAAETVTIVVVIVVVFFSSLRIIFFNNDIFLYIFLWVLYIL